MPLLDACGSGTGSKTLQTSLPPGRNSGDSQLTCSSPAAHLQPELEQPQCFENYAKIRVMIKKLAV